MRSPRITGGHMVRMAHDRHLAHQCSHSALRRVGLTCCIICDSVFTTLRTPNTDGYPGDKVGTADPGPVTSIRSRLDLGKRPFRGRCRGDSSCMTSHMSCSPHKTLFEHAD